MSEIGKPTHFDLAKALEVAQSIVDSDNVVGAMKLIDECLPAYYREHKQDLIELWRANAWKKVATIRDYSTGEGKPIDLDAAAREFNGSLRFQALKEVVERWCSQRRPPFILELGPGEYTLPIGLRSIGASFSYKPIGITHKIPEHAFEHIKEVYKETPDFHQPVIFVCYEMIEHLFHPTDIYNYYCRENLNAEHVMISTPHGALGGGWRRSNEEMIAHVRDWTPQELKDFVKRYWPHLDQQFIDGPQMLLVASRRHE